MPSKKPSNTKKSPGRPTSIGRRPVSVYLTPKEYGIVRRAAGSEPVSGYLRRIGLSVALATECR